MSARTMTPCSPPTVAGCAPRIECGSECSPASRRLTSPRDAAGGRCVVAAAVFFRGLRFRVLVAVPPPAGSLADATVDATTSPSSSFGAAALLERAGRFVPCFLSAISPLAFQMRSRTTDLELLRFHSHHSSNSCSNVFQLDRARLTRAESGWNNRGRELHENARIALARLLCFLLAFVRFTLIVHFDCTTSAIRLFSP